MGLGNFFKKIGKGIVTGAADIAAADEQARIDERERRIAEYRALYPGFAGLSDDDLWLRMEPPVVVERPVIFEHDRRDDHFDHDGPHFPHDEHRR